jgi:hypothetical protein
MNIVSAVFVVEDFAISRKQDGDRIGQQHAPRCQSTGEAIQPFVANAGVFQVYRIHQVMQGDVRVAATQASKHRCHQAGKGDHRTTAESPEKQIEPYDIRFQTAHRPQEAENTARTVVGPATHNRETLEFCRAPGNLVGKHGEAE